MLPLLALIALISLSPARADVGEARELLEAPDFEALFMGSVLVTRDGQVVLEHHRGLDRGGRPVDATTPYWVGSISKHFAAAALLRLVDAGALQLDDPVAPLLGLPAEALARDGVPCTLRWLLSHRCGLPGSLPPRQQPVGDPLVDLDARAELLAAVGELELQVPPGTEHAYSNLGFDLAGLVVQEVAAQPYDQALRRLLWEPLGLQPIGVGPVQAAPLASDFAPGHVNLPGLALPSERWLGIPWDAPGRVGASGNGFASAAALTTWFQALVEGEVLQPGSLAAMRTAQVDDYGLGLVVDEEDFGTVLWHNGALSPHGHNAYVGHVASTDTTVVVLSNRGRERVSATRIGRELMDALHDAPTRPLIDMRLSKRVLSGFVGMVFVGGLVLPLLACLALMLRPPSRGRLAWASAVATTGFLYLFFQALLDRFRPEPSDLALAAGLGVVGLSLVVGAWRQRSLDLPSRGPKAAAELLLTGGIVIGITVITGASARVLLPFLLAAAVLGGDSVLRRRA